MNIKTIGACVALLAVTNVAAAQGGFAGKASPPGPAATGAVAAGLPDIMGSTLGFAVNGYTGWGQSTTIDKPHQVKQTKAGPNKDMCVIGTGLYRTFNKGNFAVGSFTDIVYRNGSPVYTRNVPALAPSGFVDFQNHDLLFQEGMNVIQVKMDVNNDISESNESNTFEVKVTVKIDCNGDGVVAGAPLPLKNASPGPGAPAQKTPASLPLKR